VWQTVIRNADRRLVAVVTQTQIVLPGERLRPTGDQPSGVNRKR
jgi:hypothetical protein